MFHTETTTTEYLKISAPRKRRGPATAKGRAAIVAHLAVVRSSALPPFFKKATPPVFSRPRESSLGALIRDHRERSTTFHTGAFPTAHPEKTLGLVEGCGRGGVGFYKTRFALIHALEICEEERSN